MKLILICNQNRTACEKYFIKSKVISFCMIFDVDKRLDMTMHFCTSIESYVLSNIVKDNPVPINFYSQNKDMYVTFFLSQVSSDERMLLESLSPILMGDVVVITEKIESPVMRVFNSNVDLVSTLTDGELYSKGRFIHANFRFHSSQIRGAGDLLKAIVSVDSELCEIGLHESMGLVNVLDQINNRIPLSFLQFSYRKPVEREFVLEWRNIHRDPGEAIRYEMNGDRKVQNFNMSSAPTYDFLSAVAKDHIPLGSYLEHHGRERVEVYVYVPDFLLKSLLVRLYETTEKLKDFSIDRIIDYSKVKNSNRPS